MARDDVVVRIAGEGGEGVISVGEILALTASHASFHVFTFRTYPAEIKGGLAMIQVRINTESVHSLGQNADVLMAFNQEAFDAYGDRICKGGIVLYDPKLVEIPEGFGFKTYPIPLHDIAVRETGGKLSKNIVALAALVRLLRIPEEKARELIVSKFRRKGAEVVQANLKAFTAGLAALDENFSEFQIAHPRKRAEEIVISGNQAVALGAMAAGCNYVAGYPITPATPILEFLMKYLPAQDGVVLQFEDEIGALASCLGASFAGAKAMTATSGPGISLMSELINIAAMEEIPVVIVDVQRGGPGTGLPTKTEQSDLHFAMFGSAGEGPRAVIAPTTIEDCFYQTIRAFNIAERYQMPVILLSDQAMAYRTKTVDIPELGRIDLVGRVTPTQKDLEDYRRFRVTETGVSPMAIPGTPGGMYISTGLEHDERGAPNYTPENHEQMMAKRYRKLETLAKELEGNNGTHEVPDGAEVGIISWGSTEGPIREALDWAKRDGLKVAHLQPKVLMPLPKKTIENFLRPLKKVLVLEENFTGQFASVLRTHFDVDPISVTKCQGIPFTAEEVYEAIKAHV
jgi:2-oxoglutarate ferredoxin oxidoreductase subunit alpha